MRVAWLTTRRHWPLTRTSVSVAHDKDKERKPADRFTRAIALDGLLDAAQRARLLEIANKCPVHRTLSREVRLVTRLKKP